MEKEARLPTHRNGGYKLFGGEQYGIFNYLPAPKVHDIGGYACMNIGNITTQHFAGGRGFEFTDSATCLSAQYSNQICQGIHGCKAIDLFIEKQQMGDTSGNHTNVEIFYECMTMCSDSFLRSYVKQHKK